MVEKVFISPNRVRAYGNIMNMKTGDDFTLVNSELTVTTDTVDGAEMTVFQFEVEGGISIALTSSSSTCNVGDNVLLTATVLDDNAPVEAAEVTFKVGETVLGTDETDANGVATYTYATSSAGSLSFSASYQTSTSNSVSVTVNHSYSLAFSQATYTASGGSATLECTLLEDNVAKSGASITVTGTDSSTYTATTNSSGVASVTVTGISASTVFTATYQGATATCTVTVQTYLLYDDCSSSSGLSNYGSSVVFERNSTNTLAFNTDEYLLSGSTCCFSGREVLAMQGVDDGRLRIKFKMNTTSNAAYNQFCIFCTDQTLPQSSYPYGTRVRNDKKFQYFTIGNESTIYTHSVAYSTDWFYLEAIKEGTSWTIKLYDSSLTQLATDTRTLSSMSNPNWYFALLTDKGTNYSIHIKEVLAEAL